MASLTPEELVAGFDRLPATVEQAQVQQDAERGQSVWRLVLLALLAVLAVEALVASRPRRARRTVAFEGGLPIGATQGGEER